MNAVIQPQPAPCTDWHVQFKHAGIWYPVGQPMAFDAAWSALDLLRKSVDGQPVERRVVIAFD